MARPETTLILVRHGEIIRPTGTSNFDRAPLSERGEQQVAALAHHWPAPRPEIVYASNLLRALQTGRILAQMLRVPLDFRSGLKEWTPDARDLTPEEFLALEARCWEDPGFVPPSGETLIEAQARIAGTLRDIARSRRGGVAAIVGHGALFSLFTADLKGVRPTRSHKEAVPFAGYAVVRYGQSFDLVSDFRAVV